MTDRTQRLVSWLRDAHAMEQQAEAMLSAQAARLEHYPALQAGIARHLEETRGQQQVLEATLRRFGSHPSRLKDLGGVLAAFVQGIGGRLTHDEVIKGAQASFAFAHLQIAAYTVLIATAGAANDVETQRSCEDLLMQELAMADWLLGRLPELTQAFLERAQTPGAVARR